MCIVRGKESLNCWKSDWVQNAIVLDWNYNVCVLVMLLIARFVNINSFKCKYSRGNSILI